MMLMGLPRWLSGKASGGSLPMRETRVPSLGQEDSGCSKSTDTKATALYTISSTRLGFPTLLCIKTASVSFPAASPGLPC